jgi:hypothetical protein
MGLRSALNVVHLSFRSLRQSERKSVPVERMKAPSVLLDAREWSPQELRSLLPWLS